MLNFNSHPFSDDSVQVANDSDTSTEVVCQLVEEIIEKVGSNTGSLHYQICDNILQESLDVIFTKNDDMEPMGHLIGDDSEVICKEILSEFVESVSKISSHTSKQKQQSKSIVASKILKALDKLYK